MNTLVEILRPDFLLHDALVASLLVGLVCPLVGVYFVLRRMIFLGVALPQLSAAGIASAFLVYRFAVGLHAHAEPTERLLALVGSSGFTLAGLLVLATLERGARETLEARIGVTYALAAATTILCLAADPYGEAQMVNLLKGDILTTTSTTVLGTVLGLVAVTLLVFRRELRAALWDAVLYLVIGVTISLGVMTAGPLVTFGFLVIPPLTARLMMRGMLAFSLTAAALGAATAFAGFYAAYRLDLPLGPSQVAVASLVLLVAGAGRRLFQPR
jgi:ABC-type Mn2+/Zn2+ transport system permease subunit